jgi:hypothetical protein
MDTLITGRGRGGSRRPPSPQGDRSNKCIQFITHGMLHPAKPCQKAVNVSCRFK